MHRAVLLSSGPEILPNAILLSGSGTVSQAYGTSETTQATPTSAATSGEETDKSTMVGKTVAAVERDLILNTLNHCLGNRTHAANILGISIRTLRNKLKLYSEGGVPVPVPGPPNNASI